MLVFIKELLQAGVNAFSQHHIALPPGALNHQVFLQKCSGCFTCKASCPFGSIYIMSDSQGNKLPFLDPSNHPCHLCDDMPCATSCPSGAIIKMPEHWVDMGTSVLDDEKCLNTNGMICKMCYFACPLTDKALVWDDNRHLPIINPTLCTGCGNCRGLCPTQAFTIEAKSDDTE
jgi:ferredoxin-type protein NapG